MYDMYCTTSLADLALAREKHPGVYMFLGSEAE